MDTARIGGALPVIFAACDEVYFRKHAMGFCKSALLAGHSVHVILSPKPGTGISCRAQKLASELLPKFFLKFSTYEQKNLKVEVIADKRADKKMMAPESVVFYQSLRFFYLPNLLRLYKRPIIVLDIDSLVIGPISVRMNADVGLFLRLNITRGHTEYEQLGMKVLGAMVYASPCGVGFFDEVAAYLDSHNRIYYVDQRALYEVYLSYRDVRFFNIAETNWLDRKFGPSSLVWTAKGTQKRRNLTYVRERLRFEGRGKIASALTLAGYSLGLIRD